VHPAIVRATLAAALGVHATLAWVGRPPGILTGQDDAQYLMLAQSLRQGGYHELFRVDLPVHALYPPGYPAMLALWGWPAGDRFDALVALGILLSVATLGFLFLALRRRFDDFTAAAAVVVLAFSPAWVRTAATVGSEVAYGWAAMLALLLAARADDVPAGTRARRWLAAAGVAAIFAGLTRVAGVTLLAALAAHWALDRRWRPVAWLGAAGAATVGAWLVWTGVAPDQHVGVSYAADLGAGLSDSPWVRPLPGRVPHHVDFYARQFLSALAVPNVPGTKLDSAAVLAGLGALVAAGLPALVRRWRPAALYLGCYAVLLAVWTFAESRYFVPLLAVLVPSLVLGALATGRRVLPSRPRAVAVTLVALLAVAGLARSTRDARRAAECGRGGPMPPDACLSADQAAFFAALRWVRDHTPPDAVVLTAKYAPFHYYTGRQTPSFRGALARGTDGLLPFLEAHGAGRILYTGLLVAEFNRLLPRLAALCDRLVIERHFPPRTYLFSARAPGEGAGGSEACDALEAVREAGPPEG
jgi:MFS family permease